MSFSYLHAFLEPTNRLEGLPIGIVNLDRGADALGQRLDAGKRGARGGDRAAAG